MRFDLCVYWVEDSPGWSDTIKENMQLELEDEGISVEFVTEDNAGTAKQEMANSCLGFKKYDLFFVDYNISSDLTGKDIINALREYNVDVDILFYSMNHEKEIRQMIAENLSSYEGVYIANRETFQEKALNLIHKNLRKLLSIQNIRGKLMDCTSENDFIINSYIRENYPKLTPEQKERIDTEILKYVHEKVLPQSESIQTFTKALESSGIKKIKEFMEKSSVLVPLELRYKLFGLLASELGESEVQFENYFSSVVKKRNVLAHKKLDVCAKQDHIKYCDTLSQYQARECTENCLTCDSQHSISINDWESIRKQANHFSLVFDEMLKGLSKS